MGGRDASFVIQVPFYQRKKDGKNREAVDFFCRG